MNDIRELVWNRGPLHWSCLVIPGRETLRWPDCRAAGIL